MLRVSPSDTQKNSAIVHRYNRVSSSHVTAFPSLPASCCALIGSTSPCPAQAVAPVLHVDGLGKGTATLDSPWQFHVGDNPAWALVQTSDATGIDDWEQISPDKTWGAQGHPAYTGFAWYRKHIHLAPAPGADRDFALLIRHIDDAYEIYWNGTLVGHNGTLPPHPFFYFS